MSKTADAFRTISEVARELDVPKHVLRFWEGRFPQIRPMKRGGGRRYYRPEDLALLRGICHLLHGEGYTIKGVQKILREQGVEQVKRIGVEIQAEPPVIAAPGKSGRRAKVLPAAPTVPAPAAKALPANKTPPAKSSTTKSLPAGVARGAAGLPRDGRGHILAAIAELEVCRSILLGRAIEASARRRPAKARRAAART
jgi:DNA-binding transcriptional MerR regulator